MLVSLRSLESVLFVGHMLAKYGHFVNNYLSWLEDEPDFLFLDVISIDN